jgi:hypothetical protein
MRWREKERVMELAIVVIVVVAGGLSALMIYGIGRMGRRGTEQMLGNRLRGELVGRLDAKIDYKVNEGVQKMIDVVTARLLIERYGRQERESTRTIPRRLQSAS